MAKKKPARKPVARKLPKVVKAAKSKAKPAVRARAVPVTTKGHAIASMVFAHDFAIKACSAFPDDRVTWQRHPEDNHPLWTLGHLAVSYDWFAGLLDGKPSQSTPEQMKLFGPGSQAMSDVEAYPSMPEVKALCESAWKRLLKAAQALADSDLGKPPFGGPNTFAPDRLTVLERNAWHDGWHTGQVTTLRRALGLKPLMGG
jgi:hypothetical protein